MEVPKPELNTAELPKQNNFGHLLTTLKIVCLIALIVFGVSIWRYTKHKNSSNNTAINPTEAWNKFISQNPHLSNTTDFNLSYNDRISKTANKESLPPVKEWGINVQGRITTDTKDPSNKNADLSYAIKSGDISAKLDTHMFITNSEIFFKVTDNPFAQILIQQYDPKNYEWIKISTSGSENKIGFSDNDLKQLNSAWSSKNIFTPISAEADKDNPSLTKISLIFNDKGLKDAIDTTVTLYSIQQLKSGSPLSKKDKDNMTSGLEALIQKISIQELSFWIDQNQNLIKIKGSLVVPSILQTIQQLQPNTQSSFVSLLNQVIFQEKSSVLALNDQNPIGKVLGASTFPSYGSEVTLSNTSDNPIDKIIYDGLLNFEYNYSGFNGIQVLSPPKDYFDLTPFLQNIEQDINKQNLKI